MMRTLNKIFLTLAFFVSALFVSCNFETDTEVEYTVSHYQQNIDNDEYTLCETETLTGIAGEKTQITAKSYEGFTVQTIEQQKISKGMDVAVKYDRNIISCTLQFGEGTITEADGTVSYSSVIAGRYGAAITLPEPVLEGYVVEAWYDDSGNELGTVFENSGTYSASYIRKTNVSYDVLYYLQNIDDDEYSLKESETLSGMTGEYTQISTKNYEGFTIQNFAQVKIKTDLKVSVYYNRNTITCIFDYNGGLVTSKDGKSSDSSTLSGRYGAAITLPEPVRSGYVLENWYDASGNEIDSTFKVNGTYTASWVEKSSASYKVHHLFQNIVDDEYTENTEYSETLTGDVGKKTSASSKTVEGFTPEEIEQKTVVADGSTEVNIYYDRNLITFTLELAGGLGSSSVTKKYGTTVSALIVPDPEKDGETFSGWSPVLPETFTEDSSFTAQWNLPSYKVEYYFEKLDSTDYESNDLYPKETYCCAAGTVTSVTAKNISGFISQEITQQTVKSDGSTVVGVYYKRKIITIYINLNGGKGTEYIQGKLGRTLTAEDLSGITPVKNGYTFKNFSFTEGTVFSIDNDEQTLIDTVWEGKNDATYLINVYLEKLNYSSDSEKYELKESFCGTGSSDAKTGFTVSGNSITVPNLSQTLSYTGFTPAQNDDITIAADDSSILNLYFDRSTVTVSFDLGGGSCNGEATPKLTGKYGETIPTDSLNEIIINAVRSGYTNPQLPTGCPVTFPAQNSTVRLDWTPNAYKVKFCNGDQSGIKTYNYGTYYTVPDNSDSALTSLTNSGYGIYGWKESADSDDEVVYYSGNQFKLPYSVTATENLDDVALELYAVWSDNHYTVNHYLQKTSLGIDYDLDKTETIYALEGKMTSAAAKEYTGFVVQDFDQETVESGSATVINIYYNRKSVTVTILANGGIIDGVTLDGNSSVSGYYGCSYASSLSVTKLGYNSSWKNNNTPNRYYPAEDTTYEVVWTAKSYTITYNNMNGVTNTNPATYTIEDSTIILEDLEDFDIYTFVGWFSDSDLTKSVKKISTQNTCNVTVYAKWKCNKIFSNTITGAGDIVLIDGTFVHVIDGMDITEILLVKDKIAGIIAYNRGSEDSPDWRCIGLKNYYGYWSSSTGIDLSNLSESKISDGYYSNTTLSDYKTNNASTTFYCYDFVNTYGTTNSLTGNYSSDWYIPSYSEICSLMNNSTKINSTRNLLGYNVLLQSNRNYIWSCNQGTFWSYTKCVAAYPNIETGLNTNYNEYCYALHKVKVQ